MRVCKAILDLLFPPKCMFCRRVLPAAARGCCEICRKELSGGREIRSGMFFQDCCVALRYEGEVKDAVIRFKFGNRTGYAAAFGKLLAEAIETELNGQFDLITWIPVSARRLRKRGYDQAALLAMAAALELGDVAVGTLRKTVDTPAQSGLTGQDARKSNVLGAYCVPEPELVAGKRVLLIDDIITTGATMEEASRTLLEAGAKEVVAAALAQPSGTTNDTCEVSS